MQLKDYDTSRRYLATVKQTTRITPEDSEEVRELILQVEDSGFFFDVGQSIGVLVPGPHDFGHAYHFRLYSIAGICKTPGNPCIDICVKRVNYMDEYSGEMYPGIASHYLCNLQVGDRIHITGPYELPFQMPSEHDANLLMIGMGTGIAPFRAFVQHIYDTLGGWQGKIRLFYGARTGLESIYMNDARDDFANYYDQHTFQAFKAVSPRPHWDEPAALDAALAQHQQEIWQLLLQTKTYVFIAGHESIKVMLDKTFATMAGSQQQWAKHKAVLIKQKRWLELMYW